MSLNKNVLPKKSNPWFKRIPHAVTMLFGIIILVAILTYILPAGTYERIVVDGRKIVVPDSYKIIPATPIGVLDMFKAMPLGFKAASEIIFIVLAGAIMFGFMEKSKAVENSVGTLVKKLGFKNKNLIIVIMTFIYGFLGVAVGYENNIAMVILSHLVIKKANQTGMLIKEIVGKDILFLDALHNHSEEGV